MNKIMIIAFFFIVFVTNAQEKDIKSQLFELNVEKDVMNLSNEEKFNLFNLSNIDVTTASQKSEKSNKAPATIYVVTEEQIKIRGYQSLIDVLEDLPDFKIERNTNSQLGHIVTSRGIRGQENFIILLDGAKISSPTNEPMPLMENYPVLFAKQIEVVYGPASALYGADAVAGVVNIITKNSTKSGVYGEVGSNLGRFGTTNSHLFIHSSLKNKGFLSISGQFFHDSYPNLPKYYSEDTLFRMNSHQTGLFNTLFGPIQVDKNTLSPEFEAPHRAYNLNVSYRNRGFSLGFFRNYGRVPSAMNNNPDNAVYNKDVFYGQSITMLNASFSQEMGKITTTSRIVGSIYETDPKTNFRNVYVGMNRGYKYAYGSMLKMEQQILWEATENLNIVGGLTYEKFFSMPKGFDLENPVDRKEEIGGVITGSRSRLRPQGIEAPIVKLVYSNVGAYIQGQYSPSPIFTATLGARYDYNSRFGGSFNPRLGIVLTPTNKTSIKALYGAAFFAPSPFISFEQFGSFVTFDEGQTYKSFFLQLPNPDLSPLTSDAFELGVKQFIGENISFSLNTYYTILNNIYTYVPDTENRYGGKFLGWEVDFIQVRINLGKQVNYGGTLKLEYLKELKEKGYLNPYIAVSYVDGNVEVPQGAGRLEEKEIPFVSPIYVRIGTDIKYDKFYFSTRWSILGEQRTGVVEENSDKRRTLDGYLLGNLSMGANLGKYLNVYVTFTNLLDRRYRTLNEMNANDNYALRGMPQSPIRWTGGVKLRW